MTAVQITEGMDGKGKLAYFIDVKARIVGWDITVRRPSGEASKIQPTGTKKICSKCSVITCR